MGAAVARNEKQITWEELPEYFSTVAADVLSFCRPKEGVWVDLGSGSGGVGLALAERSESIVILVDPDSGALEAAQKAAGLRGLAGRVRSVVGRAESLPLLDASADLVVSRGSIFFWEDKVKGLREVYRVLKPGGVAMIGGGVGTEYPAWARREFVRLRTGGVKRQGQEAFARFREARSPETFKRLARQAGLRNFRLELDPPGIWLIFRKGVP